MGVLIHIRVWVVGAEEVGIISEFVCLLVLHSFPLSCPLSLF